jgi:ABC-type branched-subunit amino acid transport system substrate-binding protein
MRSTSVTPQRTGCSTCFAAQAVVVRQIPSALPKYFVRTHKSASQKVALLYINAGAAVPNAESYRKAWEKGGMNVEIFQGIDVSEFNCAPYVQQMKDKGIEMVTYLGPYQNTIKLQQAMKQQGFEPEVMFQDQTVYDANYIKQAGSLADNMMVFSSTELFDDYSIKEMALYRSWLDQVSPGAVPNFYGLYAWSAARLFVQEAIKLGGKLTRASMVQALRGIRDWTGNGLHVPMQVGPKTSYNCITMIQYKGGKWRKISQRECGPVIDTGVGG